MITIGVDAHKQQHAVVAVDVAGREIAEWRGVNSIDGWQQLAGWAVELGGPCRWGIEGAWNYGRGLAQYLVAAGAEVYEVNPRLTAEGRRRARRPDKTDRLDARAVARCVVREAPALPRVTADDDSVALALLVAERATVVAEATRLRNQVHALLLQLDPAYRAHLPGLTTPAGLDALEHYAAPDERPLAPQRAAAVQRLGRRLRLADEQEKELSAEIRRLTVPRFAPLTEICGVDLLTAATLAGLLGPGQRFTNDAQLAAHAGVAPLEASSAGRVRHRLNPGGDRQLNAVLHRIAMTQARCSPAAQAYLDRRVAEGKTRREALRALKRFICRAVWRRWRACLEGRSADRQAAA